MAVLTDMSELIFIETYLFGAGLPVAAYRAAQYAPADGEGLMQPDAKLVLAAGPPGLGGGVLVAPLFICLLLGRIVFFAALVCV